MLLLLSLGIATAAASRVIERRATRGPGNEPQRRFRRSASTLLFMAFVLTPLFAVCLTAFTPENYLSVPRDAFSLRWFSTLLHRADFLACDLAQRSVGRHRRDLGRRRSRYRRPWCWRAIALCGPQALTALFMSPLTIPHVVLGIALLRYLTQLGMGATFPGLVVGHVLLVTPFALRLVLASAAGMDERITAGRNFAGRRAIRHVSPCHAAAHPAGGRVRLDTRVHRVVRRGGHDGVPGCARHRNVAAPDAQSHPGNDRSAGRGGVGAC